MSRGYSTQQGNVSKHYREVTPNQGDFAPYIPPVGFAPTPAKFAIPKPINKNYPTSNGAFNLSFYPQLTPLPNGFKFLDFFRRTDVPLADAFRQQQLVMNLSLTDSEAADQNLRAKVYVEIGGGQLYHESLGDLQHHAQFVKATTQQLVEALNRNFPGNWVGTNRIGFNFETTYPPAYEYSTLSLAQTFLGGDISLVCELPSIKGQTKTVSQLWNAGQFQAEIEQRMVNRHVALLLYSKGRAGANALVANSDGVMCYYQNNPHNDDNFAERDNLTGGASYYNYYWTTPANFDTFSTGGVTIAHNNKRYWDLADWMNMYNYPAWGVLDNSDYDSLLGGGSGYLALWDKLKPSADWYDLGIPTWFDVNQRRLAALGRTVPIAMQTHYRYESGIRRGTNYDTHSKAWGLDEAVCAPWHNLTVGILSIMSAKNANSGLTVWSTVKQWPNSIWDNNINNNRPQGDRLAYRAAMTQMAKYAEYFDPINSPLVIYRNFIKYGLSGSNWGSGVTDGGNGYYRRTPKDIGSGSNPSDGRTKANVITRIITKNGAKWALIVATNWRQGKTETTTFDLRFRPADVPGLAANSDVTGLAFTGWEPLVTEVCLEPEKLGNLTGGSGTTQPTTTGAPFEPTNANANSWGSDDMLYLDNDTIKVGFRKSVGATVCHLSDKADNVGLVNDFKVTHNGVYESDKGRQAGFFSAYGTYLFNFIQNGFNTNMTGNDTGWNPVHGGNRQTTPDPDHVWNRGSPVVVFEKRENVPGKGTVIYAKVTPRHWSIPASAGVSQLTGEFWAWLDGRALRFYVRITNNRTDTQRTYEAREQETPYLYATAPFYRHFVYKGDSPWTGAALTEITLADLSSGELHGLPQLAAENFIMALDSSASKGVGIWTPWNNRFINKQFISRSGNEDSNDSSYINSAPMLDFDNNGVYEYEGAFIVGTGTQIRSWVAAQPRPNASTFDFSFNSWSNSWWNVNGAMTIESGALKMNFGAPNNDNSKVQGKFGSPFRSWAASDLQTIRIKAAFKGLTKMGLAFTKSATDNGSIAGRKDFFVIPDGLERVYEVSMAGVSGFSGTITSLQIVHASDTVNGDITGDTWMKPKRIANTAIS